MRKHLKIQLILSIVMAFFAAGCAKESLTPFQRAEMDKRTVSELTLALVSLPANPKLASIDQEMVVREAKLVAEILVDQTREINQNFQMTTGPNWHNFFIKMGWRKKGYCYHWSEELLKALPQKPLRAFQRYWGIAYKKLDENNAVIFTRRAQPIESGIVYDAWRGSGRPFWKYVGEDKKYPWQVRFFESQILAGKAKVEGR